MLRSPTSRRPVAGIPLLAAVVAVAAALFCIGSPPARAGIETTTRAEVLTEVERSPFAKGMREAGLTAGFLYSPVFGARNRQTFSYAQQDLTLGWMLNTPTGSSWYRGNFELLLNFAGAEVAQGPGSYLIGGRVLLRYNFVQPAAKWVPFIQIGAGGLGNDVYRDDSQRLIGSAFEYTLVGDIGLRYFLSPRWALVGMVDFEHISNANSASRNLGVNALGGMIGISTFF